MDMLRKIAVLFGVVFIIVGIAGYVPAFVIDGNLFGLFMVDNLHNIVHLVSGVVALFAATQTNYAKLYLQVFGVIYAIVTVLGFLPGSENYLMISLNTADNVLHLAIAVVALYFGFRYSRA